MTKQTEKGKVIKFLSSPEDGDRNPECGRGECCPAHENCGICRFEYMKSKGWLSESLEAAK